MVFFLDYFSCGKTGMTSRNNKTPPNITEDIKAINTKKKKIIVKNTDEPIAETLSDIGTQTETGDGKQVAKALTDETVHEEQDKDYDKAYRNGWTKRKDDNLKKLWRYTQNQWHTNIFILYNLKDTESLLNWIIILISTISSSLSVVQFGDSYYAWLEIYLKSGLSVSTILTTLIAAWLKKNNYVERINELDKYLHKMRKIIFELGNISREHMKDRMDYEDYEEKYNAKIVNLFADAPPYSPFENKRILYYLTKYYPEHTNDKSPWYYPSNNKNIKGENGGKDTGFGYNILHTYKLLKYNKFSSKLCSLYYCKCRCCPCCKRKDVISKRYKNTNEYPQDLP